MASAHFQDASVPGGIVHNPASPYSREMAKWEMGYSPYGPPGRPRESVGFQPFPAMFYKMKRSTTNGDFLVEHYTEATSEAHARNLEAQGYHNGQAAAIEAIKAQEQEFALLAANRAAGDRKMSEKAQAEAAQADAESIGHLPSVPETPIKKRTRRTKAQMAADAAQ